jgi:uncharacterized protein (TIGR02058 family)
MGGPRQNPKLRALATDREPNWNHARSANTSVRRAWRMRRRERVSAKRMVLEFGMGVDVHGEDSTTAACRAVSDAIRHSSLPLFQEVRERGGKMLVDVTVGVPNPGSVDVDRVRRELPHGEVTIHPVAGGLKVPGGDTVIACVAITVSVDYPTAAR